MGRPRKPLADLALEDRLRSDRHAGGWQPDGAPERPDWLSPDARLLWDSLVPALTARGVATAVDAAELSGLCDWWARYRAASAELDKHDRDSTAYYRLQILAGAAWKNFSSAASRFGLNPSDRARLRIAPPEQDELLSFVK